MSPAEQGNQTDTSNTLRPKWNAIVGQQQTEVAPIKNEPPMQQPNKRERSESLPTVCLKDDMVSAWKTGKLQSLVENQETPPAANEGKDFAKEELSASLYKAIWRSIDGKAVNQPLGPRSPTGGDWKVVGSLSPSHRQMDPIDQLLEEEAKLKDGTGSISGLASIDPSRRLRSASVIGEILNNSSGDLSFFALATPSQSPVLECQSGHQSKEGGGGQVAQLPTMLHADLGVENEADATEIFKRSSMDSILDDIVSEGSSVLQPSSDYFKNLTFGPNAGSSLFPTSPVSIGGSGVGNGAPLSATLERRRSSILGFGDWPISAGVVGANRPSDSLGDLVPCNVDDYFGESLKMESLNIPKINNRFPRRHSIVNNDEGQLEESFGHLGFGTSPKGSCSASGYNGGAVSPYFLQSNSGGSFSGYMMGSSCEFESSHLSQPGLHGASGTPESTFQLGSYSGPLWAVEFKSGRTEIFYVLEADGVPQVECKVGDLVIVEADRGEDLGKVTAEISVAKMKTFISSNTPSSAEKDDTLKSGINGSMGAEGGDTNQISAELAMLLKSKEIIPKRIHRLALPSDLKLLQAKAQEEALAMVRCQSRIRQKKLPMEVVDAEYQWDRNKLTFFFVADRRIDFRELVRDLFRIYKTRIWMCAVDKHSPRMINYLGGLVPVHAAANINPNPSLDCKAL